MSRNALFKFTKPGIFIKPLFGSHHRRFLTLAKSPQSQLALLLNHTPGRTLVDIHKGAKKMGHLCGVWVMCKELRRIGTSEILFMLEEREPKWPQSTGRLQKQNTEVNTVKQCESRNPGHRIYLLQLRVAFHKLPKQKPYSSFNQRGQVCWAFTYRPSQCDPAILAVQKVGLPQETLHNPTPKAAPLCRVTISMWYVAHTCLCVCVCLSVKQSCSAVLPICYSSFAQQPYGIVPHNPHHCSTVIH